MRNFRNIILVGCKLEKYEWHLYDNDSGNLSSRVSFLSKEMSTEKRYGGDMEFVNSLIFAFFYILIVLDGVFSTVSNIDFG